MSRLIAAAAAAMMLAAGSKADDAAKAAVERALKETGWDKRPSDHSTWKDKGKFTMPVEGEAAQAMTYEGEFFVTFPDKYRFSLKSKVADQEFDLLVVVNGDKGWERMMGQMREMPKEKVAYVNNEIYMMQVLALKPLLDPAGGFTLKSLPDEAVNGRPSKRVVVEKAGRPAITLWLDTESGLPAKLSCTVKNEFDGWKDATDEMYMSEWKQSDTGMAFTRMRVLRNGRPMLESEMSDYKMPDKVDPKLYEKPAP